MVSVSCFNLVPNSTPCIISLTGITAPITIHSRRPTGLTQSGQRHWCLVKEMKTLCMSANHAAGMCTEPTQRVEQLKVMPAGLSVWSGCLSGLSMSVLRPDWPSCLLVGLWGATPVINEQPLGFLSRECAKRNSIFVRAMTYGKFSFVYIVPYEVIQSSVQEWYKHLTYSLLMHSFPTEKKTYMASSKRTAFRYL